MNESDSRTLETENSLHTALQQIEQGLKDLDRFKKASDSLDRASQNSTEILTVLMEASQLLSQASANLSDQSLAVFEAKIDNVKQSIQDLPAALKPSFSDMEALTKKQLIHAHKMNEKHEAGIEALKHALNASMAANQTQLSTLKIGLVAGNVVLLTLLGYGLFKLGVFG